MRTRITYITEDGKEFDNKFNAKAHECELTDHSWEFFNENMGLQSEERNDSKLKLCKNCTKQVILQ